MDVGDSTTTSSVTVAPPKRPLARHLRTTLLIIVVAAACYVSYGLGKLWAEWRQATSGATGSASAAADTSAADFRPMAAVLPLDGPWSFADLDWNLRSAIVAPNELATRIDSLPSLTLANVGDLPDVNDDLIRLAQSLRIEPIELNGNQVYALDRPDFKARIVVRPIAGRPKVIALAAAYPESPGQWRLFEGTPRASSATSPAAAHLLPLPPGAERNGARYADDGRLLLELVSLQITKSDALLATWQNAGWQVRPSGLGDPSNFSYLCARGDEVIYAWSADPRDALENLMLVRSPTDAEIKIPQ